MRTGFPGVGVLPATEEAEPEVKVKDIYDLDDLKADRVMLNEKVIANSR